MREEPFHLARAPIVEAVVDFDCDLPAGFNLLGLEEVAGQRFQDGYPKRSQQWLNEVQVEQGPQGSAQTHRRQVVALRFHSTDEKQLVQARVQGFSFNRLAPYGSLDTYLPAIQSAWKTFVEVAQPLQVRVVKLRYVNRIEIPAIRIVLSEYFKLAANDLWGDEITIARFLSQYSGIDNATRHELRVTLSDAPEPGEKSIVILDIEVAATVNLDPSGWDEIVSVIGSLRALKNKLFKESLTSKCLQLFQD